MTWLAGVDGCRRGWFRACRNLDSHELRFEVIESPRELVARAPYPTIIALDMPVGLAERGSRACDVAARGLLGPRRSSVFPAPIRRSLIAQSREEADRISRPITGKGVSAQAYGIYPKVRSVDELLAVDPGARATIREVHPEVSFWAWNGCRPMRFAKKKAEGRAERQALVEAWLGEGILERARGGFLRKDLADDDILDALAALWTAHRIAAGESETLPPSPPSDARGLPMQIVV